MPRIESVLTDHAPKPIGPYSQAVKAGPYLFCSGQVPLDPQTGEVKGSSVEEQTELVMKNLGEVLKAGGLDFGAVAKTTIFIKDMNDFPKINAVYGKYFTGTPPARATVEVSRLPKDVQVEIEAIAVL